MGKSPGELLIEELDLEIAAKNELKSTVRIEGFISGLHQAVRIVNHNFHTLMGTEKYLSHLDLGQLERAMELAQTLIDQKVAEDKIELWVVRDGNANLGFYKPEDYDQALYDMAQEFAKKSTWAKAGDNKSTKLFVLRIDTILVRESEVELYLKN